MEKVIAKNISDIAPYAGPHAIPGIRFRPVREALGVTSWGMNVLELDAHCTGYPEHDHAKDGQEEVYLVLSGSLVLEAEGASRTFRTGDFIRVAPPLRRKFVTKDEAATLLALGGTPGKSYTPSMGG
ncbi:MAG: hypothetical protein IPG50_15400 [Myxococcales bacterium]|nr:hypothetical protein [Myxococcales bacterium]